MTTGQLIQIGPEHRAQVQEMRRHVEEWLAESGEEQFHGVNAPKAPAHLDTLIDTGCMYGWVVGGDLVAVGSLTEADRDFWADDEADDPRAAWLARVMTSGHGSGHGAALIEALAQRAREEGKTVMRLDCWRDNTGLHDYYRRYGWRHVRTETVEGRQSGALFERPV